MQSIESLLRARYCSAVSNIAPDKIDNTLTTLTFYCLKTHRERQSTLFFLVKAVLKSKVR